jgi:hypothetical protein
LQAVFAELYGAYRHAECGTAARGYTYWAGTLVIAIAARVRAERRIAYYATATSSASSATTSTRASTSTGASASPANAQGGDAAATNPTTAQRAAADAATVTTCCKPDHQCFNYTKPRHQISHHYSLVVIGNWRVTALDRTAVTNLGQGLMAFLSTDN